MADEDIITTLAGIAETFQVTLPEDGGLEMYIAVLKSVPGHALAEARQAIIMKHKWPRLPYPAEILEETRAATGTLELARRSLVRARQALSRALDAADTQR